VKKGGASKAELCFSGKNQSITTCSATFKFIQNKIASIKQEK